MTHHCHANACSTPTPPRLFMCTVHWRMLPDVMQQAIWTAYRANPGPARARAPDYLRACADAVEHVARLEGKPEGNSYRRVLAQLT